MPYSPILHCSVYDVNDTTIKLTGDPFTLIRHHSSAYATMYAQAQGGASINMGTYVMQNGGDRAYGNEHTFYNVASNTFQFGVEDSEGRYASARIVANMVDYIKLTCNAANIRPAADGDVTISCSGDFFNGNFGAAKNEVKVMFAYRVDNGEWSVPEWLDVKTSGNSYTASKELTGLDYKSVYDFSIVAEDELMSVNSQTLGVTSKPVFHWGQNDVTFEVPVNFNSGDIRAKGNLWLKGDDDYGNYLYFGDKEYCYISEQSDGVLKIKAPTIDLDADSVTLKGNAGTFSEYGGWIPFLSDGAVGHYYSNVGWYSKTGRIVTVGFYIKAYCNEGFGSIPVAIYGLPYTPANAAAGGGMCSGALIQTNKNFQCFVAETTGLITTRAQACDGTAGNSLATSASACFYPTLEILTVSGTISYFTNN